MNSQDSRYNSAEFAKRTLFHNATCATLFGSAVFVASIAYHLCFITIPAFRAVVADMCILLIEKNAIHLIHQIDKQDNTDYGYYYHLYHSYINLRKFDR